MNILNKLLYTEKSDWATEKVSLSEVVDRIKKCDDFFILVRENDEFTVITKTDDSGDDIFERLRRKIRPSIGFFEFMKSGLKKKK